MHPSRHPFKELLEDCPVIAAVKNEEGLQQSLLSDSGIIFILHGDLCGIGEIVRRVHEAGKTAMVHTDLVNGLSGKDTCAVDYLRVETGVDGIISTKPSMVRHAGEIGMYSVLRVFLLYSMAYENISRQCLQARPDCIEVLPGLMPKVIRRIVEQEQVPVIAGGLVSDKEDIMNALQAGAVSVSTTKAGLWFV